jgi:hypothetical protein
VLVGAGLKREEEASLLLSQSLLRWNSAQFSSSLDSLSQGTAAFLDSAGRSSASSEVKLLQFIKGTVTSDRAPENDMVGKG